MTPLPVFSSVVVPVLAIDEDVTIFLLGFGVLGLLFYAVYSFRGMAETRAKEQTKREVAAYVAEGSIKAEDAAVLLNSGSDVVAQKIADAVAWGTIKPEKADQLLKTIRSDRARPSGAAAAPDAGPNTTPARA